MYDPFRTTNGYLGLKAYRLSDAFMQLFKQNNFSCKAFANADVMSNDIFEEIPIKVHNSHLVHGFLYELREDKNMSCDAERLSMFSHPFLEKNLEIMSSCIDDYTAEQSKFQYFQRQAARDKAQRDAYKHKHPGASEAEMDKKFGKMNHPSRLETMLITNQIQHYADHINATTSAGINKAYVVDALRDTADLSVHSA